MRLVDITGQRFGRLLAVERCAKINGRLAWRCRCDCGDGRARINNSLRTGKTGRVGASARSSPENVKRTQLVPHGRLKHGLRVGNSRPLRVPRVALDVGSASRPLRPVETAELYAARGITAMRAVGDRGVHR